MTHYCYVQIKTRSLDLFLLQLFFFFFNLNTKCYLPVNGDIVRNMVSHFDKKTVSLSGYNARSWKLPIHCHHALCVAQSCHILVPYLCKYINTIYYLQSQQTNKITKSKGNVKLRKVMSAIGKYFKMVVSSSTRQSMLKYAKND